MDSIETITPLTIDRCESAWTNSLKIIAESPLPSSVNERINQILNPHSSTIIDYTNLKDVIKDNPHLFRHFPIPKPPLGCKKSQIGAIRFYAIQKYLWKLGYNHLGVTFHDIKKTSSFRQLMRISQEIIQFGLPIKCLEAVLVATYLSMNSKDLDRIPVAFKSEAHGVIYRHIVLVCKHNQNWGALGLSRKEDLMYKPLKYESLGDLLCDFMSCYEKNGHKLLKIKLGLPMISDQSSNQLVTWKYTHVDTSCIHSKSWNTSNALSEVESFCKAIRILIMK